VNTPVAAPAPPPPSPPPPPPPLNNPIAAGSWSAPAGATPATGNYVYLQSDSGDYVGAGRTYSYTQADALMTLSGTSLTISMSVKGNQNWLGTFILPRAAGSLQAGSFKNLTRAASADPEVGGIDWTGDGRGCSTIKGSLVIDKIEQAGGAITVLDLRFQQHCEGATSALHGQIHWTKANADNSPVSAPSAIPANLWQPAPGVVPPAGNYFYMESGQGDYIGGGRIVNYTQANSVLSMTVLGNYVSMRAAGDQTWTAEFKGMNGASRLEVGYYAGLLRYPFNNPVLGGLNVSGAGRGCNQLTGWFAVDSVSYEGTALTSVEIRFEQLCQGSIAPLRGKLHWKANDMTEPSGPQNPPPPGLWKPGAWFAAPSGNYIYLVSDIGDYIGAGNTQLLTPDNTAIMVETDLTAGLRIRAGGWTGEFFGMNGLSQLQPGYYGNLQAYPFHNKAFGGLSWGGNGRGCNKATGWFVVHHVSYLMGKLVAIDLRFEQHCEGGIPAQRGVIHWVK
jgi:hypothetical protein